MVGRGGEGLWGWDEGVGRRLEGDGGLRRGGGCWVGTGELVGGGEGMVG